MPLWLMKSEPETWSWDQQVSKGTEAWTGVRNHQAAGFLKAMQVGDRCFFYHSNTGKAVVGIVTVVRGAYPDPTDSTGRFVCVDVAADRPLPFPVPLARIKEQPELSAMMLLKQARLSVMPVTGPEWDVVCRMGGLSGPAGEGAGMTDLR